ncbi:MFS transporter [Microbacterium protaetiae]|uniref:MFS transporter n=1 Tax=Microbacterium protaetiae TaxID=2509458 RepID=A0A4P6EBA8_9MICO|nr:MFS transporter [Microbacterium protaetiae]QAY58553.1 MFS transporter [Microbacterium protaetiae]
MSEPTPAAVGEPRWGLLRQVGLPYFVIAFIARLPFAMMVVGVLTLVVSARGSLSLGGLNSAAVGFGTACFGPLLGAASDRFGQRPVLLGVGIANGIVLAGFAWLVYSPVPDAVMLVGAFLIGATAPQVAPLSRARLVAIIGRRIDRTRHERVFNATMAYESAADETVFVFGPLIVGILASLISPWAPLVGAAALTIVFVTAFALHPTAPPAQTRAHAAAAGPVSELFRPALVVVVVGILGVGFFFGAMLTSLTAFMDDRGISEQAGLLYGVMGIGSATLALGVALFPERFTRAWRWLCFGAVIFVGSLVLPFVPSVGAMAAALAVMGLGIGPTLVTQYSIGAERSPVGRSSTVMAILGSAVIVGQSLSSAVTGEVAQRFGTPAAMVVPIVSAAIVVAAGVGNALLSRGRYAAPFAHTQPSGNVPDSRNSAS